MSEKKVLKPQSSKELAILNHELFRDKRLMMQHYCTFQATRQRIIDVYAITPNETEELIKYARWRVFAEFGGDTSEEDWTSGAKHFARHARIGNELARWERSPQIPLVKAPIHSWRGVVILVLLTFIALNIMSLILTIGGIL